MNKAELITELGMKYYKVDEAGLHEGTTQAGITVWGIGVFEKIGDVVRKNNLTFYTEGDDNAYWGVSEPNPDTPASDPTFTDRVNTFLASKITDETIKFAHITEVSEFTLKALVSAVANDNTDKIGIVTEVEGVCSLEVL